MAGPCVDVFAYLTVCCGLVLLLFSAFSCSFHRSRWSNFLPIRVFVCFEAQDDLSDLLLDYVACCFVKSATTDSVRSALIQAVQTFNGQSFDFCERCIDSKYSE